MRVYKHFKNLFKMSGYFHLKTCVFITLITLYIAKKCFYNCSALLKEMTTCGPFRSSSLFRSMAMKYKCKGQICHHAEDDQPWALVHGTLTRMAELVRRRPVSFLHLFSSVVDDPVSNTLPGNGSRGQQKKTPQWPLSPKVKPHLEKDRLWFVRKLLSGSYLCQF